MSATTRPGRAESTTTRSARKIASCTEWVTRRIVAGVRVGDREQLEVEPLAGQLVEGAERLVEQQHRGLEHEASGRARRAGACRRRARLGTWVAAPSSPTVRRSVCDTGVPRFGSVDAGELERVGDVRRVVRHGRSRGSWNTRPMRGFGPSIGRPSRVAAPRSGASRPAMTRSSVDLPLPFGPISATIWPGSTTRSTPSSATQPLGAAGRERHGDVAQLDPAGRLGCRSHAGLGVHAAAAAREHRRDRRDAARRMPRTRGRRSAARSGSGSNRRSIAVIARIAAGRSGMRARRRPRQRSPRRPRPSRAPAAPRR